jgi:hypothetical protein
MTALPVPKQKFAATVLMKIVAAPMQPVRHPQKIVQTVLMIMATDLLIVPILVARDSLGRAARYAAGPVLLTTVYAVRVSDACRGAHSPIRHRTQLLRTITVARHLIQTKA